MVFPWLAAATFAGAASSAYSAHRNRQNQKESISRNEEREDSKIQRTVEQAKAAGIHPLAALGASPSYSSPSVVDTTGDRIGDGIARTAQALKGEKQSNLQNTLIQTQIDEATSRTQLAKAQAFRVLNPQAEVPLISTVANWQDRNGNIFQGPNPEANEMSPHELVASNAVLAAAKAAHDAGLLSPEHNIIDRAWEASTGRPMRRNFKDKTNYSTSTKGYNYRKTKLKPYPTKKWQPH